MEFQIDTFLHTYRSAFKKQELGFSQKKVDNYNNKFSLILIQPHGVLFTRAVFAFNESIISLWNIYEEPKFSEVSC